MSVIDDYGRYFASPRILRSSCFPLQVDRVREADISRWLTECETAGLILLYEVDGKPYLVVFKVDEPRAKFSKYPNPPPESARRCAQMRPSANSDSGSDAKSKSGGKTPQAPLPPLPPGLDTPTMRDAFGRWIQHRREIGKPLKPTMVDGQFRQFAEWGEARAVKAIDHTIAMGWQGLREPDPPRSSNGAAKPSRDEIEDARADRLLS